MRVTTLFIYMYLYASYTFLFFIYLLVSIANVLSTHILVLNYVILALTVILTFDSISTGISVNDFLIVSTLLNTTLIFGVLCCILY